MIDEEERAGWRATCPRPPPERSGLGALESPGRLELRSLDEGEFRREAQLTHVLIAARTSPFIPLRWQDGTNGTHETDGTNEAPRRRYLEQELLEVSAVAIPANPDALALGVKSGAVGKEDVRETLEVLRCVLGDEDLGRGGTRPYQLLDLARELRRVMQKA